MSDSRMPPGSPEPRQRKVNPPGSIARLIMEAKAAAQPVETEQPKLSRNADVSRPVAPAAALEGVLGGVSELEAKWDMQIHALQTTGSLDIRDLEASIRDAPTNTTIVLDATDIRQEILAASNAAAHALDASDLETRLPPGLNRISSDLSFPRRPEEKRNNGSPAELRPEDLPATVLSAVVAAARLSAGADPGIIPDETEFDSFVTTLQHTANLSLSQRMAIVEFTHGPLAAVWALPYFIQGAISQESTVLLPSVTTNAAHRRLSLTYHWATVAVLTLFVLFEGALILGQQSGPFSDEAIYILSGMRTIEGYGLSDNYLTWFAGSLLWPVVAASGYIISGLIGARLIALACTTLAIAATAKASRNLFGEPTQFWTALTLAISGPTIFLAHLAVYDQLALAGIAVSFWAVSHVGRIDERRWLIIAALAFAVAVLAKYPMILCLAPLVGVLYVLRRERAHADLFILLFASIAVLLIYVLPLRPQLVQFLLWRQENNPSFGATTATVRFSLLWYGGIAWLLAGIGWIAGWFVAGSKRLLTTILIGGLLLWPAYHFLINNVVSEEKHQVFGFLFGYPIVGAMFAGLWLKRGDRQWLRRGLIVLALVLLAYVGTAQALQMDHSWPDSRPAITYLATHVQPGQRILANEPAAYQMALYRNGNLQSPWDVYDTYRVSHGEFTESLCSAGWFIDSVGGIGWPDNVRHQIQACATFREVFVSTTVVTQLGRSLDFVTYPVQIRIWFNTATSSAQMSTNVRRDV